MSTPLSRRWAVIAAASGTVLIGAGAFWLSFVALADLAVRSGIEAGQAWIWPLLVDGLIVVATVAVVALDGHRSAWYPWALLIAGALMSVTANAAHALVAATATVPGLLASTVAAVPPLVLLASTHLTVVLTRSTKTAAAEATDVEPQTPQPGSPALPAAALIPAPQPAPAPKPASEPEPAEPPDPAPSEPAPVPETESGGSVLGRRERAEALRAAGWSNKAIARELGVHASTVGRWAHRTSDPASQTSADAEKKKEDKGEGV
ncbi:DUF2637 domain-containing protein [Brachybacterium tyrofermentans]|uniref:DUF2637 domain-containing protein n=1 Tax=Brachybacterium tyrofermentans TaxID=47848 RepID=UPI003FD357DB